MASLTTSSLIASSAIPSLKSRTRCKKHSKINCFLPLQFKPDVLKTSTFGRKPLSTSAERNHSTLLVCAAALSATCSGASQTQTVERPTSVITNAPSQAKEKSPDLDDGGAGFPPRDDGDGGGGGGGGGDGWKGGFAFFGFLAFLGFLKDKEEEGPYRESRRR